ncbi:hypothetical protein [Streptomyces sp. NPDC126499]|uniref:hypothetical protein n=1 Tax=Streptomyces sp. NPDC126499 TaxID=3155314 RepID=UPI00332A68D1
MGQGQALHHAALGNSYPDSHVMARRMGLSLRSCQRHVSDLMRTLGARNRLHAGYLLARAGL